MNVKNLKNINWKQMNKTRNNKAHGVHIEPDKIRLMKINTCGRVSSKLLRRQHKFYDETISI